MHSEGQAPSNLASEAIDIPTAAEVIAGMNAKSRDNALEVAEQRYWEVAWDCGCSDEAASAWVTSLMSHLQEQIERMRERQDYDATSPPRECRSMEKIVTRAIGGLLLVLISPILLFIWIGLKAERADPAITMRTTGRLSTYSFVLGSGWISSFVRRAELRALPSIWHLVNGDTVLRFEDLARIISPSSRTSA
jgi:hypothetical protein